MDLLNSPKRNSSLQKRGAQRYLSGQCRCRPNYSTHMFLSFFCADFSFSPEVLISQFRKYMLQKECCFELDFAFKNVGIPNRESLIVFGWRGNAAPPMRRKQHHTKDRWNNTSSIAQRRRGRQLHHPKRRTGDYHFASPYLTLPYITLPHLTFSTLLNLTLFTPLRPNMISSELFSHFGFPISFHFQNGNDTTNQRRMKIDPEEEEENSTTKEEATL